MFPTRLLFQNVYLFHFGTLWIKRIFEGLVCEINTIYSIVSLEKSLL